MKEYLVTCDNGDVFVVASIGIAGAQEVAVDLYEQHNMCMPAIVSIKPIVMPFAVRSI